MLDDYTHCGDPSLSSMKRKRNRRYEKPDLVLFGTLQELDFSRPLIFKKFSWVGKRENSKLQFRRFSVLHVRMFVFECRSLCIDLPRTMLTQMLHMCVCTHLPPSDTDCACTLLSVMWYFQPMVTTRQLGNSNRDVLTWLKLKKRCNKVCADLLYCTEFDKMIDIMSYLTRLQISHIWIYQTASGGKEMFIVWNTLILSCFNFNVTRTCGSDLRMFQINILVPFLEGMESKCECICSRDLTIEWSRTAVRLACESSVTTNNCNTELRSEHKGEHVCNKHIYIHIYICFLLTALNLACLF